MKPTMRKSSIVLTISLLLVVLGVILLKRSHDVKADVAGISVSSDISDMQFIKTDDDQKTKIIYNYKGEAREQIEPIYFEYDDGISNEFCDFDKNGIDEIIIYSSGGMHGKYAYPYLVNNNGSLSPIAITDFIKDDQGLPIENDAYNWFSDAPSFELRDMNDDGYLDMIVGQRDYDTDGVNATNFWIYTWDNETNKFMRI